jgi:hypothetical protein
MYKVIVLTILTFTTIFHTVIGEDDTPVSSTTVSVIEKGELASDLEDGQVDTEGKEEWSKAEDGYYGAGQSESDDPLPGPVLNFYPQFGHRDFVSLSTIRIEGGGSRYHSSGVFVSVDAGGEDQKFIIIGGPENRVGVSGSSWGSGSPTGEKWFEDASSYGIAADTALILKIERVGIDITFTINGNRVTTQKLPDGTADLASIGFGAGHAKNFGISDWKIYVTGQRLYKSRDDVKVGIKAVPISYPNPGYGPVETNQESGGVNVGIGVTLEQCKDACDAIGGQCEGFQLTVDVSRCQLYTLLMDNMEKEQRENDDVLLYVLERKDDLVDEDEVAPTGSEMDSAQEAAEKAEKAAVEASRSAVAEGPGVAAEAAADAVYAVEQEIETQRDAARESAGARKVEEEEEELEEEIVDEEEEIIEEEEKEVIEEEEKEEEIAATGVEAATGGTEEEEEEPTDEPIELPKPVGCLVDLLSGTACSNRGECGDDGKCTCFRGYEGDDCENMKCVDDCNGLGSCDTNTGICTCSPGVSGIACEIECPARCSNRGTCFFTRNDENVYHARCLCEVGFEGESCEQKSECENQCSSHGRCFRGKCLCDPSFSGPDCSVETLCTNECSGHGKCFNSKCFCEEGWSSDTCNEKVECDPVDCNGHGRCFKGSCMCDATHIGPKCDIEAEATSCSTRGISIHGTCACLPFFTGPECAMFTQQDQNDELTPSAAMRRQGMKVAESRHGVYSLVGGITFDLDSKIAMSKKDKKKASSVEECANRCVETIGCAAATWDGTSCDMFCNSITQTESSETEHIQGIIARPSSDLCATDWKGSSAMPFSVARLDAGCPNKCNAPNGLCVMGGCVCRRGYEGVSCELYTGEQCGRGCENGICVNSRCECLPGYTGEHCEERESCGCEHGICENDQCTCEEGYFGKKCEKKTSCEHSCNNKGICFRGKMCICQPGYKGEFCEMISLPVSKKCPESNGKVCGGHGKCQVSGQCVCDVHYSGSACDIRSEDATCARDCSNRGICEVDGTCSCDAGFEGPDCSRATQCNEGRGCGMFGYCFRGMCVGTQNTKLLGEDNLVDPLSIVPSDPSEICPQNCNYRAVCFEGACLCSGKYSGAACELYDGKPILDMKENSMKSCPNDCGGPSRGLCVMGSCHCFPGFGGEDCLSAMPIPCPNDCSKNGICHLGDCYCDPGFQSKDCSREVQCHNNCTNGRGVCRRGQCECFAQYSGEFCENMKNEPGCPENCNVEKGQGFCHQKSCYCNPGFQGKSCGETKKKKLSNNTSATFRFRSSRDDDDDDVDDEETAPIQLNLVSSSSSCDPPCVHGTCFKNQCLCDKGFRNSVDITDCSEIDTDICPNECSGDQGRCTPKGCQCFSPYSGESCELENSPLSCPNNCSPPFGTCVRGECRCVNSARTGSDCSEIKEQPDCPNSCSGFGLCHNRKCYCVDGHTGLDCSELVIDMLSNARVVSSSSSSLQEEEEEAEYGNSDEDSSSYSENAYVLVIAGLVAFVVGSVIGILWLRGPFGRSGSDSSVVGINI